MKNETGLQLTLSIGHAIIISNLFSLSILKELLNEF